MTGEMKMEMQMEMEMEMGNDEGNNWRINLAGKGYDMCELALLLCLSFS